MEKILVTIDVSKITKSKIVDRTYANKEGVNVTVKDYKMEIVPLNEKKLIKETDKWSLWKTHFVCEEQTKAEKEQKIKSKIIGDGVSFTPKSETEPVIQYPEENIGVDNDGIPF